MIHADSDASGVLHFGGYLVRLYSRDTTLQTPSGTIAEACICCGFLKEFGVQRQELRLFKAVCRYSSGTKFGCRQITGLPVRHADATSWGHPNVQRRRRMYGPSRKLQETGDAKIMLRQ